MRFLRSKEDSTCASSSFSDETPYFEPSRVETFARGAPVKGSWSLGRTPSLAALEAEQNSGLAKRPPVYESPQQRAAKLGLDVRYFLRNYSDASLLFGS